jgi:hypothetical protein
MLSFRKAISLKQITGKENLENTIFVLFFFSLILGIDLGFLKDNLATHGSIILSKSIFTLEYFICLFIALLFCYYSFKERHFLLRASYIFGTISLILAPSVINYLGFKWIYLIKILTMFFAIIFLTKYIREILKGYKAAILQK